MIRSISIFVLTGFVLCGALMGQDEAVQPIWDWRPALALGGIAKEIEADDEQMHQAYQLIQEENRTFLQSIRQLRAKDAPEKQDKSLEDAFNQQIAESRRRLVEQLSTVFLPHQARQLDHLAFWVQVNDREGFSSALLKSPAPDILELTDTDRETIRRASERLQSDFEKKVRELQEKYRDLLLDELSPSQRSAIEEALGNESDIGSTPLKF